MNYFSTGLWCVTKNEFHTRAGDDQLSGCTEKKLKALSKAKLAPKKVMVTVRWSAASLIHYRFLNPSETTTSEKYAQQIDEMHQKRQYLQPALINRKGPIVPHDNTWPHIIQSVLQKLN